MTTLSVPIPAKLDESINNLIKNGYAENKASFVRKAITRLVEDEAVLVILRAQEEPTLKGDLKTLAKKFK